MEKKKNAKLASSRQSSLATLILYISFKKLKKNKVNIEILYKRMNAILKAMNVSNESWVSKDSQLYKDIINDFEYLSRVQNSKGI